MIVRMKKITVIMQAKDADSALSELRRLGILHVEHQRPPLGKGIAVLQEDLGLVNEALGILSLEELCTFEPKQIDARTFPGWKHCARHIIDVYKRIDQLKEYSRDILHRIEEWQRWGDFDPAQIQHLKDKNIYLRLYEIPEKQLISLPANAAVKNIFTAAGISHCAVISQGPVELQFKEVALPKTALEQMRSRLEEDKNTLKALRQELCKLTCHYEEFLQLKKSLEKELEFEQALSGMGQEQDFSYIGGYIPSDAVDSSAELAKKQRWGFLISDPSGDEHVPTFIRNPRWVSLISPLVKLLEITPGYTELDISPLFLVFFSLFFGMIIGDAGYGLVYLIVTCFAQRKFAAKLQDKRIFPLLYLLSSCAIVWGLLTGTFFGQAWLAKSRLRPMVPVLNDQVFLQGMCFFIGTMHLTLAHLWRFVVQVPALTALAELGWVSILWAAFLLTKMLLLGAVFPGFGKYLIIGGISLVVLFSSPRKNIFATIAAGLGTIALSLMNSFGDIVSYVRLFAVGLAGVAISDAFNAMAAGARSSGIIGILTAASILIAGHLLNFVLSPMSVLVHGVRLNVLEFSGHAGITWSGMPYKPLKE
jgi:V/A-type H+-transporting ATPase subunit I